jgi:RNA polymerase-binding protein DksA
LSDGLTVPTTRIPEAAVAIDIEKAKEELLLLRDQLGGEDERLVQSLATSLEEVSGEESSDQHMADVGTITHDRELEESIQGNTERLLSQVKRALAKMDEGTYGICDRCGKPIEDERLLAIPYASLCMQDQRSLERSEQI